MPPEEKLIHLNYVSMEQILGHDSRRYKTRH